MSTDALPSPDPALLPDDPAVLKALVVQLLDELQKERAARDRLEHHLHLLLKRIYARREQLPESGLTLAEQNVAAAKKPAEAIPGCLAGPGLLAQVIVSKGADHLPLYRLEGIFERQGVKLSRQTMDGWWLQTAEFLRPLYTLAVRLVLASHVLHTDDTQVRVRDAWQKLKYKGSFWTYVGDPLHPLTVFDYTPRHTRDGPAAFLKDYRGYLQADAFNGYDGIYLESNGRIVEVACWAHARRKFHECRRQEPARMETALAGHRRAAMVAASSMRWRRTCGIAAGASGKR
jgi:transposase